MIPEGLMLAIDRHVDENRFTRVGFQETDLGTVFVAEKKTDEGWLILYATRDPLNIVLPEGKRRAMLRTINAPLHTPDWRRFDMAVEKAKEDLADNNRFVKTFGKTKQYARLTY